jgi:hypothetical protein
VIYLSETDCDMTFENKFRELPEVEMGFGAIIAWVKFELPLKLEIEGFIFVRVVIS